jgi:hypothetical protein
MGPLKGTLKASTDSREGFASKYRESPRQKMQSVPWVAPRRLFSRRGDGLASKKRALAPQSRNSNCSSGTAGSHSVTTRCYPHPPVGAQIGSKGGSEQAIFDSGILPISKSSCSVCQAAQLRGPTVVATSMIGFGNCRIVRTNSSTIAPSNCAFAHRSSSVSASEAGRPFL